ncbi:MAG: flavodoxin family protein [Eubacterium sp.]
MKKLLIINSSPREDGVCAEILKQVKSYFIDCEIKEYDLYRLSPAPCTACGYCEMHDGCSNKDLDIFFEDFEDADYIAVFSPMYNNFFPAPFKALIDRFQRYCSARYLRGANPPIEKHKNVGLVIASGSNARECANYMANTVKQAFAVLNGTLKARYYIPNTDAASYTFNIVELEKFVHQMRKP